MPERSDTSIIQGRIRHELQFPLDEYLPEHLSQHCFLSGDDAWSVRYAYSIIANFPDETIYCGSVTAKAKKKFAEFIQRIQPIEPSEGKSRDREVVSLSRLHISELAQIWRGIGRVDGILSWGQAGSAAAGVRVSGAAPGLQPAAVQIAQPGRPMPIDTGTISVSLPALERAGILNLN